MKTIVIACGAGLATSSMVREQVESLLRRNGIQAKIMQCTLSEVEGLDDAADLIITTMKVRRSYQTPCITGSAFLSGVGEEETATQILDVLQR